MVHWVGFCVSSVGVGLNTTGDNVGASVDHCCATWFNLLFQPVDDLYLYLLVVVKLKSLIFLLDLELVPVFVELLAECSILPTLGMFLSKVELLKYPV